MITSGRLLPAFPLQEERIKAMIVDTEGTVYENLRTLEQDLTFYIAAQEFSSKALEFGAVQQQTLRNRDKYELYTNLRFLLSDQCPHKIKAAIFQGNYRTTFRTRREFSGSLLSCYSERIEIASIGGLPQGISLSTVNLGLSAGTTSLQMCSIGWDM